MNNISISPYVVVIIPVYNPDNKFKKLLAILGMQSIDNMEILLIDSGEDKSYRSQIPQGANVTVKEIPSVEFNHGGTRQWGMNQYPDVDVYVFLTQDAILADEYSIAKLIVPFVDDKVGAVYGRQLPHKDARIFARIARCINYGNNSYIYSLSDREKHGMKTCFMSNSFAAYRPVAMKDVGGFPTETILSEDMYVAAKMLMKGWKIGYVADACVLHSHNYSILQEFKRYFDIGVFHSREKWIRENFGSAEKQGKKFILYELKEILRYNPLLLVEMICRDIAKWSGYKLGGIEKRLPLKIKKIISMTNRFWDSK